MFVVIENGVVVYRTSSLAGAFAYRDVDGVGEVAEVLSEAQEKPVQSTSRRIRKRPKTAVKTDSRDGR